MEFDRLIFIYLKILNTKIFFVDKGERKKVL
jgi:hypothetical protein